MAGFKVGKAPWEIEEQAKQLQAQSAAAPTSEPISEIQTPSSSQAAPEAAQPNSFVVGQEPWKQEEKAKEQAAMAAANPPPPKTSAIEAGLQGAGQGAVLGYLPQVQAGLGVGYQNLREKLGGDKAKSYDELRDAFQKRNNLLREEHPYAYGAGNVAGAVGSSMALPVGGLARGSGLLLRAGEAGLIGAGYGGLANPEVDGDVAANLKQRLHNAKMGFALGAGGEALTGTLGPTLEKAGERLAQSAVVKQIGANAGQIKKILQKDEIPKIEGFLAQEKLMRPGTKIDDVVDKANSVLEDVGPKLSQLYKDAQAGVETTSIGQANRLNGPQMADEILAAAKAKYKSNANRNAVMKEIEESVAPLRDMGENANIVDVHDYRKSLDENIDWSKRAQERDAVQKAFIDARNYVADKTKNTIDALDKATGGKQLQQLKDMNASYSAASTVNNIATQGLARETAKSFMGHGVIGAGAFGAGATVEWQRSHDPLQAVLAGAGTATALGLARKYGTPASYYTGKAEQALGRGLGAMTPNPAGVGAGLTSPWVNMSTKEKTNAK